MSAKPKRFNEDMITRTDIPHDVFTLIHDLAYDHEGRDRFQYRTRAQQLLMASNRANQHQERQDLREG